MHLKKQFYFEQSEKKNICINAKTKLIINIDKRFNYKIPAKQDPFQEDKEFADNHEFLD